MIADLFLNGGSPNCTHWLDIITLRSELIFNNIQDMSLLGLRYFNVPYLEVHKNRNLENVNSVTCNDVCC
jgi:hypothetical protein